MGTFFSVIISIVLGIYAFGFLSRILLKFWLKRKIENIKQGNTSSNGGFNGWSNFAKQKETTKKEGEVTITSSEKEDRKIDKTIGQYVEFDEVNEEGS